MTNTPQPLSDSRQRRPMTGRSNVRPPQVSGPGSFPSVPRPSTTLGASRPPSDGSVLPFPPSSGAGTVNKLTTHGMGSTKSMAERINERLASIAASKVIKVAEDDVHISRPFTPTDHSLTYRPPMPAMGIYSHKVDEAMKSLSSVDPVYLHKSSTVKNFSKTFPKKYVDYALEPPETMAFDQSLATDNVKKTEMAKNFITRNRDRMWMFDVDYVGASHGEVLNKMLDVENFPGLMDELTLKERKHLRGRGSESVLACLTMTKKGPGPGAATVGGEGPKGWNRKADTIGRDEFLATTEETRTAREKRMVRMFHDAMPNRIRENNRVCYFKGF